MGEGWSKIVKRHGGMTVTQGGVTARYNGRGQRSERRVCQWCGREVSAYIPKGGDGSAIRIRKHKGRDGQECGGSYRMVE